MEALTDSRDLGPEMQTLFGSQATVSLLRRRVNKGRRRLTTRNSSRDGACPVSLGGAGRGKPRLYGSSTIPDPADLRSAVVDAANPVLPQSFANRAIPP